MAPFLLLLLGACQEQNVETAAVEPVETGPVEAAPVVARENRDALTFEQAQARKARVGEVHYTLFFDLASSDEEFGGEAKVQFDLSSADLPLTIDFSGAEVDRIVANGDEIPVDYNGFFLTLPTDALLVGDNEVRVDYRHPYDRNGTGLHRFTDPEDGLTYLYTYLWPYYANRLFPAFDQPNLKGTFSISVNAPGDWTVVSTAPGMVTNLADGNRSWVFETTPKMSTYILSLHAGPYQVWESMAGEVPIRLFARQSLAEYVAVDEWFEVTRSGLDFFARYFEIPYPFGKYDQLIVPDFNIGAMENIAAVTFNEGYVQRQPSSHFERESRASVILHEMAHMWFGNLVTKDWWNGLWLNESFATLMSNFAMMEATEFTDAWHRFFIQNKQAAYFKDSRVTTHPIEVPVASTADFFLVFDDITYQKGSSVLKQLAYFVGYENFRVGVANYLEEHAYGNTILQDFIDAQAASSGRELDRWSSEWLYQSGFNELQAEVECADGLVTGLEILQSAPESHPQLRQHRVELVFYTLGDGKLQPGSVFDVEVDGAASNVAEAVGSACPAFAFPNHDDWGYARVVLDDAAISAIDGHIQDLEDPLARSVLIRSLYDMSHTGRMPIEDYVTLALAESQAETNLRVLAQLTGSMSSSIDLLYRLRPGSEAALAQTLPTLEEAAWTWVNNEADPDRARLWFDLLLRASASPTAQDRLRSLLDETVSLPAVPMSQNLRWRVVIALAGLGVPEAESLIADEQERDPSDLGEKMAIAADAVRPLADTKQRWIREITSPESGLGLSRQRFAIFSLFPARQSDLQAEQLDRILESLPALSGRDPYFVSSYVSGLLRPVCTHESTAAMGAALDAGGLNSTSELFLREALQADEECLALRSEE
jgi:aminopeptidase N